MHGVEELAHDGDHGRKAGVEPSVPIEQVHALTLDDEVVSSSVIRGLVAAGAVERAATLLGRPHLLRGTVVQGDQRGARQHRRRPRPARRGEASGLRPGRRMDLEPFILLLNYLILNH